MHAPQSSGGKSTYPTRAGAADMTFSSSGANAYYPYTPYPYPHPLTVTSTPTSILPPDRSVDWSQAGVTGDIPMNRPNCTTTECNTLYGGTVTTASINNAIASAPANTVVRIPAGTYSITSSIQPKSNVTLRGAGIGVTILKGASGFSGDGLISYSDITNWYLSDQPSYDLVFRQF